VRWPWHLLCLGRYIYSDPVLQHFSLLDQHVGHIRSSQFYRKSNIFSDYTFSFLILYTLGGIGIVTRVYGIAKSGLLFCHLHDLLSQLLPVFYQQNIHVQSSKTTVQVEELLT